VVVFFWLKHIILSFKRLRGDTLRPFYLHSLLANNCCIIHIVKNCRTNANLKEIDMKKEGNYKFDVNILFIYNELGRKSSSLVEKCIKI